jgi:nitrogen regulatory protein PII
MSAENASRNAAAANLKCVFLVYNRAMDEEISEELEAIGIRGFTKWVEVQGRGATSGSHFDTEVWPGANYALFIAVEENRARQLLDRVREMRRSRGQEGVKAFLLPLEDLT